MVMLMFIIVEHLLAAQVVATCMAIDSELCFTPTQQPALLLVIAVSMACRTSASVAVIAGELTRRQGSRV